MKQLAWFLAGLAVGIAGTIAGAIYFAMQIEEANVAS